MIQKVRDALFFSRLFYFTINGLAIILIFKYDTEISIHFTHHHYKQAIYLLALQSLTTYLFLNCDNQIDIQPQKNSNDSDQIFDKLSIKPSTSNRNSLNEIYNDNTIRLIEKNPSIELQYMIKSQNNSPKNLSEDGDIETQQKYDLPHKNQCVKCNVIQNYRQRHCDLCQKCIYKFDHHCFWVGCCIGELNHRKFFAFVISQAYTSIYLFLIFWKGADNYKNFNEEKQNFYYEKEYAVCMLFALISFLFALFTTILTFYHIFLIATNQTSWEHTKRKRITYLQIYPKGFYPFNKGLIKNFQMVFCHKNQIQDWKLPSLLEANQYVDTHFNIIENKYYNCCQIDDANDQANDQTD